MMFCSKWKPVVAMVAVEIALAGFNLLVKNVLDKGLNHLVLVTYRQLISTVFLAPIAYFWERKSRPKFTLSIFWHLFFSAMVGVTLTQYFSFIGIDYTNATYSCAFINMVPVVTFLIALPFGLETVNMTSTAGKSKVLGTVVSVGGAMLLTLYKGTALTIRSELRGGHHPDKPPLEKKHDKWTVGSIAMLAACLCWSSWFPMQAKIGKRYPAFYSSTALLSCFSAIQSAALNLVLHRDPSSWVLKGTMEVLTVIYAGVVASGLCFAVMAWCVKRRGPLFAAGFSPLIQIIVATIDFLVLHEQLYMGSILGSLLVMMGLYFLLWGKSKEAQACPVKQVQDINENQETSQPA